MKNKEIEEPTPEQVKKITPMIESFEKVTKKRVGIQVFPGTMESLRRLRAEIEIETGKRLSMDGVIQRLVECGKTMLKVKEINIAEENVRDFKLANDILNLTDDDWKVTKEKG